MKYSAASSILYKKFLDMAQYKPSPISIFDALIGMAIAVYRRGTQECVDYYQTLCDESQAKVDQGIGVSRRKNTASTGKTCPSGLSSATTQNSSVPTAASSSRHSTSTPGASILTSIRTRS